MMQFNTSLGSPVRLLFLWTGACVFGLAGCATAPIVESSFISDGQPSQPTPKRLPTSAPSNYQLQIGDLVDVFVIEDSSFNGNYPVRQSGDIIIPKLGRIAVVGKSLPETEGAIAKMLEGSQLRHATVVVDPGSRNETKKSEVPGVTISISGNVMKKGRVTIAQLAGVPVTAFQAVTNSGGFAPFANKQKAYIIRFNPTGSHRIPVNFDEIERGISVDVPLRDGDALVVPQKTFGF